MLRVILKTKSREITIMQDLIPFNKPPYTGNEDQYIVQAAHSLKQSGDGPFTLRCQEWFDTRLPCLRSFLTPSCTHALEMAAILIDIQPGDEVIMPSYTFVSTANAFVLRGAKIIFVDIVPGSMNLDLDCVEAAITDKTKAIVPVHYAGIACDMDRLMEMANKAGVFVVEDAAQGLMAFYKGRALGTIGHLGAFSFHETKNYTSGGEGGLLLVNDPRFIERAEIIREKGTNRSAFFRGMVDKYRWVDIGSSYLPSELQAAYLWGQLEKAEDIKLNRMGTWQFYYDSLLPLDNHHISLPHIPETADQNAHMFFLKVKDIDTRTALLAHMKDCGVLAVFHYVPLHSSKAGITFGRLYGEDQYTTRESQRLIRLPLYYGMLETERSEVIQSIHSFFK